MGSELGTSEEEQDGEKPAGLDRCSGHTGEGAEGAELRAPQR